MTHGTRMISTLEKLVALRPNITMSEILASVSVEELANQIDHNSVRRAVVAQHWAKMLDVSHEVAAGPISEWGSDLSQRSMGLFPKDFWGNYRLTKALKFSAFQDKWADISFQAALESMELSDKWLARCNIAVLLDAAKRCWHDFVQQAEPEILVISFRSKVSVFFLFHLILFFFFCFSQDRSICNWLFEDGRRCDVVLADPKAMMLHQHNEHAKSTRRCGLCDWETNKNNASHYLSNHSLAKIVDCSVPECKLKFKTSKEMKHHYYRCHSSTQVASQAKDLGPRSAKQRRINYKE